MTGVGPAPGAALSARAQSRARLSRLCSPLTAPGQGQGGSRVRGQQRAEDHRVRAEHRRNAQCSRHGSRSLLTVPGFGLTRRTYAARANEACAAGSPRTRCSIGTLRTCSPSCCHSRNRPAWRPKGAWSLSYASLAKLEAGRF